MVVPLTVIVSPLAKLAEREFVPAAPDSAVALVIAVGGVCWLVATAPVALLDGSKKSLPAATADAATRSVFATFPIEVFKAALRLAAVAAGVAPIAKVLAGAGVVLDAVNVTDDVVPSGRLKLSVTASPNAGGRNGGTDYGSSSRTGAYAFQVSRFLIPTRTSLQRRPKSSTS